MASKKGSAAISLTSLWVTFQACELWRTSPFKGDQLSLSMLDVYFCVETAENLTSR